METTARAKLLEAEASRPTRRLRWTERAFLSGLRHVRGGSLRVRFPSGAEALVGDHSLPMEELMITRPAFFRKVLASGSVGFGEAFVDGDWDTPDLTGLLALLAKNQRRLGLLGRGLSWVARSVNRLHHRARRNTVVRSRENIQEHYDLSNAFYGCFLDNSMTYSSALF